MIYLDYSANTPADSRVLERFCEVERSCPGNANSRHQAGRDAKLVIDHATQSIAGLLSAQPAEVIYTSGASEANSQGAGKTLPPSGQAHHLHPAGTLLRQRHPDRSAGAGL